MRSAARQSVLSSTRRIRRPGVWRGRWLQYGPIARLVNDPSPQRPQVEDLREDVGHDVQRAVGVDPVSIPAVVAVVVSAAESLTEVVLVIGRIDIQAVVAVEGVLVGVGIPVVEAPAVLPVRLAGPEAFLVAVVHGLPEEIGGVLIDVVILPATIVTIAGGGVEVGITPVVVCAQVLKAELLLAQMLEVVLLEPGLREPSLLLKEL